MLVIFLIISAQLMASAEEKSKDWLEFYYLNPKPDEFISQMEAWQKEGVLRDFNVQPVLIAFISQLMRENREKIQPWWLSLKEMAPEDRAVFGAALLFARVGEADVIVEDALGKKFDDEERPPKILEIPLDKTSTLDMLWGFYYATGSESAVRRIVKSFLYEAAPLKPQGVKIPEGYIPFYTELPRLAYESMHSNMLRHEALVLICEKILESDQSLTPPEKSNLYDLLSEVKPEKYPVKKEVK